MTRLPLVVLPGALLVAFSAPHAFAQEPAPPAHVAYVEGRAVLEHDTSSEDVEPNLPLDTGDRLRTERGRVEVLFGDGSILQLDEDTTIDVLSDSLVRELAGRLALIAGTARAGRLQVDTPAGSVRIMSAGDFRVSVFDDGGAPAVEVAVIRGSADLFTDQGTVSIGAGARAVARQGETPSQPMSFNSARWDAFDRWSQDRLSLRRGAASHSYVPPPLRPYGAVLDTHGSWNYEAAYGYVWFPRVVGGWRPYYQGRWRFYPRFGWTWVGGDVWAWPTHHYGRWGTTAAGAWFWVPGSTWGPAWVHWAVSPGYVSWCALGFDGRPVVPFGYGYRALARAHYRYDPWRAWTVVPRGHFGGYGSVSRLAIDGRRFGPDVVRPFVLQAAPPARPYAVARAGTGAEARVVGAIDPRVAPRTGSVAVPRGSFERPGRTAASREWGRDLRWSNQPPADQPQTAVRGGAADASRAGTGSTTTSRQGGTRLGSEAGQRRENGQQGHYGAAVPRRPPDTATAPGAAAPRPPARQAWSPDSVPVYRAGTLTRPEPRGAAAPSDEGSGDATLRSGRTNAPAASSGPFESRRAVPRGGAYAPAPSSPSPAPQAPGYEPPTPPSPRYQPRPADAPAYQPPPASAPPPPAYRPSGSGQRYRDGPGPSGPSRGAESAEPRQPPARRDYSDGAPRGSAEPRGRAERAPAGSPPAAARSRRR